MNLTPLIIALILWSGASAATAGFFLWQRMRDEREAEFERVLELPKVLRGQVLDVNGVPVVIGRSPLLEPAPVDLWEAKRQGFAQYVDYRQTRLRGPIGTDEGKHHYRRDTVAPPRHIVTGRHLEAGERDSRQLSWVTYTQAFETLAADAGHPVQEHGPREAEIQHQRLKWTAKAGWEQAELDIEAVA